MDLLSKWLQWKPQKCKVNNNKHLFESSLVCVNLGVAWVWSKDSLVCVKNELSPSYTHECVSFPSKKSPNVLTENCKMYTQFIERIKFQDMQPSPANLFSVSHTFTFTAYSTKTLQIFLTLVVHGYQRVICFFWFMSLIHLELYNP